MTGVGIFFLILFLIIVFVIITSYTLYKYPKLVPNYTEYIKSINEYINEFRLNHKNKQKLLNAKKLEEEQELQEKNKLEIEKKSITILTEINNEYMEELKKINLEEFNKSVLLFPNCHYVKTYFNKSITKFYEKNQTNFGHLCRLNASNKSDSIMKTCTNKLKEDWENYNLLLKKICNAIDTYLYSTEIGIKNDKAKKSHINDFSNNFHDIAEKITIYDVDDLDIINNTINQKNYENIQDYGKHFLLYANPEEKIEKIEYDTDEKPP